MRVLGLRAYLSFKKKQETEYTLAVGVLPCALNELLSYRLVFAKRPFHCFLWDAIKSLFECPVQSGNALNDG